MDHLFDAEFINEFGLALRNELQSFRSPATLQSARTDRAGRRGELRAGLSCSHLSTLCPQLSYGRHRGPARIDSRRAAVAIVVYPHRASGQLCLTLTRRPITLSHHGGQICLPGGRIEQGESPIQAALREYEEELGVKPEGVAQLGSLSPIYVFASDNWVETVVVTIRSPREPWRPDPVEVDQVIEMPLSVLIELSRKADNRPNSDRDPPVTVPSEFRSGTDRGGGCKLVARKKERLGKVAGTGEVFRYRFGYHAIEFVDCEGQRREVWGATAMVLGEFAAVIGRAMVGRP